MYEESSSKEKVAGPESEGENQESKSPKRRLLERGGPVIQLQPRGQESWRQKLPRLLTGVSARAVLGEMVGRRRVTNCPCFPRTKGFLGMWTFPAKTGTIPGKLGLGFQIVTLNSR